MKRLLAYLFIVLGFEMFISQTNKSFAMEFGQGELKLNDSSVKGFIRFVKGKTKDSPYIFSIAEDGKAYAYWICPAGVGRCAGGNHTLVNKSCLKNSKKWGSGAKCHVLAHVRTIRWDNGINKKTKFKSKWSDDEIKAKLTELGFYGNTSSTTTQTIEKKKKTTQLAKKEPNQTQEVDQLHRHLFKPNTWIYFVDFSNDRTSQGGVIKFDSSHFLSNDKNLKMYTFDVKEKHFTYQKSTSFGNKKYLRISKKLSQKLLKVKDKGKIGNVAQNKNYFKKFKTVLDKNKHNNLEELIEEYVEETKQYNLKNKLVNYFNNIDEDIQIAKAEPNEKPKSALALDIIKVSKEFKVAKVAEPPREIIPDSDYEKFLYSFEKREFANYVLPNKLNKKFKNCKTNTCRKDKSGKFVYKAFIKNSEKKKIENPGDIIHGMAMYEILFLTKVNMSKKYIARFVKKNPYYDFNKKLDPVAKIFNNSKKMNSLIKMNNTREKLRKSLGMDLSVDINTALSRYWVLGDVLNLGDVKVTKTKLHPDVKKRKKLLKKYQETLAKFNKKLKENENL